MTLDEAYEILGVSKDASPVLVRVAYKEKRKSAGTKFESELYSEAYLTIIGTRFQRKSNTRRALQLRRPDQRNEAIAR